MEKSGMQLDKEKKLKNDQPIENMLLHQACGVNFFQLFKNIRRQRNVSIDQLVSGVMTRRAFLEISKGTGYFSRETWEFLMHRLGAVTDYFEVIVSRKELEDWREREDICLLVCEKPDEAKAKLEVYRRKHLKLSGMANQFCFKIQWLLQKETATPDALYNLACEAVTCTVLGNWKEELSSLWLAPSELESILLVAWSLVLLGENEQALILFHQVWNYPEKKGWESRMKQLVYPQAAIVGMKLYEQLGNHEKAFSIGMSALELLRRENSQRYVYPLLVELIDVGQKRNEEKKIPKNLQQLIGFRDAFKIVYEENQLPCLRVWQRGSIENCYDVSLVLKRMRLSLQKTQEEVCTDQNGNEFLQVRHLSRIENGKNRPSKENFQLLTAKMGYQLEWITPMLETDSIEVLSMRQDMMYLINMRKWDEVKVLMDTLRKKMGEEACQSPRIKQELLSVEAIQKFRKKMITPEEALKRCEEALACTFPLEWLSRKELPFLQREEGMIICDIADLYGKIGKIETAESLFRKLYEVYLPQQQFLKINTPAYSVILEGYSKFVGDIARYQVALEIDENNLKYELAAAYIVLAGELLYNKAWDYYELDQKTYIREYRREFLCAQRFAEFSKNQNLVDFLSIREEKYLKN